MPRSFLVKKAERVKVDKTSFFCDDDDYDDDGYHGYHGGYHGRRVVSPSPVTTALAPYTPSLQPLAVRLANGYIHDLSPPQMYTTSEASSHEVTELEVIDLVQPHDEEMPEMTQTNDDSSSAVTSPKSPFSTVTLQSGDEESVDEGSQDDKLRKDGNFQKGVTVGYTYDAFFITDGRSRKKTPIKEPMTVNETSTSSSPSDPPGRNRAKYTCNECGKQYATSSNLSRHKQTHRSLDSKNAKKCPRCSKVYVSMPALSMHILTHDLRHSCPVCDKSFSRPWLLQGHMRSHSGEKPYGCAHCGKAFADRSNLRAHMQTHSSFKDFRCKRCNKSFALKSYLNKHYESACFKDADCGEESPCSPGSTTSSHGSV